MNCEVFFEINGSVEEQKYVARRIMTVLRALERNGDIAKLDINSLEAVEDQES